MRAVPHVGQRSAEILTGVQTYFTDEVWSDGRTAEYMPRERGGEWKEYLGKTVRVHSLRGLHVAIGSQKV